MANTIQLKLLENKSIVAEINGKSYAYEGGYHIIAGENNATEFEITSIPLQYANYEIKVDMTNAQGEPVKADVIGNRKFKLPPQMAVSGYGSINIKAVQGDTVIPWLPLKVKIWNNDWKQSPVAPALITIGETETLPPDSQAYVENVGTDKYVVLNVGIPKGTPGIGNATLSNEDGDSSENGFTQAAVKGVAQAKNYYNLGAYDTYVSNGDGTATITRKTGYIVLNGSENFDQWTTSTPDKYRYHLYTEYPITEEQTNSTIFNVCNWKSTTDDGTFLCMEGVAFDTGGGIDIYNNDYENDLDGFKQWLSRNPINIQYKTSTSFTETVIENQPLNTLGQNGSQWLREEWEKGLNLSPASGTYSADHNTTVRIGNWFTLKAGTYTQSCKASIENVVAQYLFSKAGLIVNSPIANKVTFTINEDTEVQNGVYFYGNEELTFDVEIMLNEGSHAYPYQPYHGNIVRSSEVPIYFSTENVSPASTIGGTWTSLESFTVGTTTVYAWKRV